MGRACSVGALASISLLAAACDGGQGTTHGDLVTFDGGVHVTDAAVGNRADVVRPAEAGSDAVARRDVAVAEASALDATGASDTIGLPDACTAGAAIMGGEVAGGSTFAFGATLLQTGGWSVSSLASNVASPPSIVALSDSFLVAFVDVDGALEYATTTWAWSSPASIAGVAAKSAPSLAVVGGVAHVVYQDADGKYVHGTYSANAGWDSASDPVGGAKQGFGPAAPVAASVAGNLVIAYGGEDGALYDETWTTDGGWSPDSEHTAAAIGGLSPALVALQGAASDALIVYTNPAGTLFFTVRTAGSWSSPATINVDAFTGASVSLAPLSGGRAIMAYLGDNQLPYFSVYDATATPPWTTPLAIASSPATLLSPPSVAPGVCGDDAVVTMVTSAGATVSRYTSGAWSPPSLLQGTAGMTFATVGSHP